MAEHLSDQPRRQIEGLLNSLDGHSAPNLEVLKKHLSQILIALIPGEEQQRTRPEKLAMLSPDLVREHISRLAELFPSCIAEHLDKDGQLVEKIDFDALRQELSDHVVDGPTERYQITWPGKRDATLAGNAPTTKTLRPVRVDSVDFDHTGNLFIEGDNLTALKLLQKHYLGRVKMIYIDPPYNTGKDRIYKDNFAEDSETYLKQSLQMNGEGERLIANTDSNGRFHSDWLSMMYPRLRLARTLLAEDGVIFISCDDNEIYNARRVCDVVFGSQNYQTTFYIKVRHENRILRDDIDYQLVIEALLCYSRSKSFVIPRRGKVQKEKNDYRYDIHIFGECSERRQVNGYEVEVYPKDSYEIIESDEGTLKLYQIRGSLITQGGSASEFYEHNLRSERNKDGIGTLYKVIGMGVKGDGIGYRYIMQPHKPNSKNGFYFQGRPISKTSKGLPYPNFCDLVNEFNNVGYEGEVPFQDGKKPLDFISQFTEITTSGNDIILDFFAGSGTTAHAVMRLNAEDGGNRRCISVQLDEPIDPSNNKQKQGYDFCQQNGFPPNIAEISKERIRRAGQAVLNGNCHENWNRDIGFRVLKIDKSCMKDVWYFPKDLTQEMLPDLEDNIREGRSGEDLLFQVMLDLGLDLSLPLSAKTVAGRQVYCVADDELMACFETGLDMGFIRAIVAEKPLRFVCLDRSIADDADRYNLTNLFRQTSPHTTIRVI